MRARSMREGGMKDRQGIRETEREGGIKEERAWMTVTECP